MRFATNESSELQKFHKALTNILSVPHEELQRRENEWKKRRKWKKRTKA